MGKIDKWINNPQVLKTKGKYIDWKNSLGAVVNIHYLDNDYDIKLVDFFVDNGISYFKIEYNNNIFTTPAKSIKYCKIGDIVTSKVTVKDFLEKTNYIIDENCFNSELDLNNFLQLKSKTDQKTFFICKYCGKRQKKLMAPRELYEEKSNRHRSCEFCGRGVSYPERIMSNLLELKDVNFIKQASSKTYSWIGKYKYDFLLYDKNILIETNGKQHYDSNGFKRSLEEEQKNDSAKKELALKNNMTYYEIDCRYSDFNFIKSSIEKSGLLEYLGIVLSNEEWEKIKKESETNYFYSIIDFWEKGTKTSKDIDLLGEIFKTTRSNIIRQLKKANNLGLIIFNTDFLKEERIKKAGNSNKINKYKCELNGEVVILSSYNEIKEYFNLPSCKIVEKLVKTGEKYKDAKNNYPHIKGLSITKIN